MICASHWKAAARRAIQAAIDEAIHLGLTGEALEKHVRANGYPFGERAMHPYKIWCREVKGMLNARPHQQTGRKGYNEPTPLFKDA